jgi:hypothetical protein
MIEKMRKACCETASSNFSGDSRVSDVLEDRTTVTAPIMAMATPKRSRWYRDAFRPIPGKMMASHVAELLVEEKRSEKTIGY